MNSKQQNNLLLDVVIFLGFILAFLMDLTGVALHQWVGLLGGVLAAYHLYRHWGWVKVTTQRFFGKVSNQTRLYYLVDFTLMTGFAGILFTGLLISTWFNVALANAQFWLALHIVISIGTLLACVVKVATHWRWITVVMKKMLSEPSAVQAVQQRQPEMAAKPINRREFMQVMGVVAIATVVPLTRSMQSLQQVEVTPDDVSGEKAANSSASPTSNQSASSGCVVQCRRRCAYPGRCRRYTDKNNNNLCDLGECA